MARLTLPDSLLRRYLRRHGEACGVLDADAIARRVNSDQGLDAQGTNVPPVTRDMVIEMASRELLAVRWGWFNDEPRHRR